jgi:hypothetical protein
MWHRILMKGEGVYVNRPLACYRETAGNTTSRLSKTGDDLTELTRFGEVLARRVPNFDRRKWRAYLANHAQWAADNWRRAGDRDAELINHNFWRTVSTPGQKLDHFLDQSRQTALNAYQRYQTARRALKRKLLFRT